MVAGSKTMTSSASVEEESVPLNESLPPATETNALADATSVSSLVAVNLIASPTLYPVPAASMMMSLIEPALTSVTCASALPLPAVESNVIKSPTL